MNSVIGEANKLGDDTRMNRFTEVIGRSLRR